MGFFSKIKENFKKGGVKIAMEAPDTVRTDDEELALTLTIAATDTARTINEVRVVLDRSREDSTDDSRHPERDTVFDYLVPNSAFTLNPQESRTMAISVPLTASKALGGAIAEDPAAQAAAAIIDKVSSVANAMDQRHYRYTLRAIADVDGITLDPSSSREIHILKPGEFKKVFRLFG